MKAGKLWLIIGMLLFLLFLWPPCSLLDKSVPMPNPITTNKVETDREKEITVHFDIANPDLRDIYFLHCFLRSLFDLLARDSIGEGGWSGWSVRALRESNSNDLAISVGKQGGKHKLVCLCTISECQSEKELFIIASYAAEATINVMEKMRIFKDLEEAERQQELNGKSHI